MDTTKKNSLPNMEGSESEKTLKDILETNDIGFVDLVYDPLLKIDNSINNQLFQLVYEPLFEIYDCLVKGFKGISENNFKSRIEEEIRVRDEKLASEKVKKAEESVKKEKDPKKTDRDDISKFLKTGNIFKDTLTGITRGIKDDIMDFTDTEVVSGIKLNQIITPLEKLKDSLDVRSEDQILNDKIVDKLDEIKGFQEALDLENGKSFTDEERKIAESNLEVSKKQLELLESQKKSQTQQQEESLFKTDSQKVKDAVVSEDGKMKSVELKDDEESFKLPTIQGIKDKFQSIRMGISAISASLTSLSSGFISLLGPFAPIIGTIAAIAYVGYALYNSVMSMFDVFEETGSVMEALKVGISTFLATLITLPFDLIKGAISYIADFLGFEKFSKILDSFSFVEILTNAYKNLLDWIQFSIESLFDFIMLPFKLLFDGVMKIFEGDFSGGLKDIFKGILSYVYAPFRLLVNLIDSIFGTDITTKVSEIFDGVWDSAIATLKDVAGTIMGIFDFDWMSMLKNIPGMSFLLDKMGIGGKEEGGLKPEKDSGEFVSEQERRQKRLSMTKNKSMKDTIKRMDLLSDLKKNDKTHSGYEGAEKDRVEYGRILIGNSDVEGIDKFNFSKQFNIPLSENLQGKITGNKAALKSLIGDIQNPKKDLGVNLNEKEEYMTNARRFFLDNQHLLSKKNLGANLNEKESALKESNMEMNSPKQSKGDVAVISDSSTKSNSQINITKEVKAPSLGRGRFTRGAY